MNIIFREDIGFILESERINNIELSERAKVSRTTLNTIAKTGKARDDVLFHGSKNGLSEVTVSGARDNCDFGQGFYLGETYNQALSFVCEKEKSCVYSFKYALTELREQSTKLIMKLFDYRQMSDVYYAFHTQDPEWCIRNLLEINNLTEDIFDNNIRLKQIIKDNGNY